MMKAYECRKCGTGTWYVCLACEATRPRANVVTSEALRAARIADLEELIKKSGRQQCELGLRVAKGEAHNRELEERIAELEAQIRMFVILTNPPHPTTTITWGVKPLIT